jgi:hypothetical protein
MDPPHTPCNHPPWRRMRSNPPSCVGIAAKQRVQWAAHAEAAAVEHMGIDHGRADITMTEQLLDGPNVGALFQQLGSERMTESMAAGRLADPAPAHGVGHGALHRGFVERVAVPQTPGRIPVIRPRGKDPLRGPTPLSGRIFLASASGGITRPRRVARSA